MTIIVSVKCVWEPASLAPITKVFKTMEEVESFIEGYDKVDFEFTVVSL